MGKSKGIIYAALERLDALMAPGEKRSEAKVVARQAGQAPWTFTDGKMHAYQTRTTYQQQVMHFIQWCRTEYGITRLVHLDHRADELASMYLTERIAQGYSAWTLQTERSALRLFFSNRQLASEVVLPQRRREHIIRSRGPAVRDAHIQPKNWLPLIHFLQACGLRREEVRDLCVRDVYSRMRDGQLVIHVCKGKGGKEREVPVFPGREQAVLQVIEGRAADEKVFQRLPGALDIHAIRRTYAQELYEYMAQRPLPPSEGRLQATDFDRTAVQRLSMSPGVWDITVLASFSAIISAKKERRAMMKAQLLNTHSTDFDSLITEGIEAVREAIDDGQQNHQRYRAVQGQPQTTRSGNRTYTFQLEDDWEPRANTEIQIELDTGNPEHTITGTILSIHNRSITLVTERPLPLTALTKITIFEATVWLLERLQSALLLLQEQGETSARMGAKTFGLLPCHEAQGRRQAHIATFLPDADQTHAIEVGMASERLILVGPPGTGKTSVQCALILEHLLAGKTILLATPTHVALDNAMKRLKQYCEQSGNAAFIKKHQVVRIGVSKDLVSKDYQDITLQGIVDQHLGELAQEREALQQEQSNLEAALARLARNMMPPKQRWRQRKAALQAHLETNRQEYASCEIREKQRLTTIETRFHILREEQRTKQEQQKTATQTAQMAAAQLPICNATCKACELALQSKERELASFRAGSFVDHLFARLSGVTEQLLMAERERAQKHLKEVQQMVITHEQQRNAAYLLASQLGTQLLILEREEQQLLRAQKQETDDAKQLQVLATRIIQDEQQLQAGETEMSLAEMESIKIQRRYNQVMTRLNEIEDQQRLVVSQVIANAKVIGTTLTGITTSPYLRGRLFDVVLIDEASMVSLTVVLVAATRARKSVMLFGDPNQLSPIVQLRNKKAMSKAAYWLGTNLFSHLHVTLEDADARRKQVVFLSQQSRMLPEIAATVSQFIYGGRLKNRMAPDRIPLQLAPSPASPLLLIDTSDVDRGKGKDELKLCLTKQPPRGSSKYNEYHVDCIVQLVRLLLAQLPDEEEPMIGIVTPYGAQKILNVFCILNFMHYYLLLGVVQIESEPL